MTAPLLQNGLANHRLDKMNVMQIYEINVNVNITLSRGGFMFIIMKLISMSLSLKVKTLTVKLFKCYGLYFTKLIKAQPLQKLSVVSDISTSYVVTSFLVPHESLKDNFL